MATNEQLFQTASIGNGERHHTSTAAYKLGTGTCFPAHMWQICHGTPRVGDRALQKPLPVAATSFVHSFTSWAPYSSPWKWAEFCTFLPRRELKMRFCPELRSRIKRCLLYIKQVTEKHHIEMWQGSVQEMPLMWEGWGGERVKHTGRKEKHRFEHKNSILFQLQNICKYFFYTDCFLNKMSL